MNIEIILRLLGGVLLLASNAFFVATEFALTRIRQYSPDEFKSDDGLARAWEMTEKLEFYLTGCQVGITFSSVLLGIVAEPAVTALFEPLLQSMGLSGNFSVGASVVLSVLVINLMHTIWAEQTPTYLGIEEAKLVAKYFATPHYYWTKMTYPFIYVGDKITKATLRFFGIEMTRSWTEEGSEKEQPESTRASLKGKMAELLRSGNVSSDRREEVVKALEIDEIPVRDIMVSRDEIVFLSEKKTLSENLNLIQSGKSRYPLAGESEEDYRGVIYASEMLANIEDLGSGKKKLGSLCRSGMKVSPDLPVSKLIDQFQDEHQELALVLENNVIQGLVTITDALEAIVGSAEDPMDIENNETVS